MNDKQKAYSKWDSENPGFTLGFNVFSAGWDARDTEIAELKTQIEVLKRICGESYQVVGAFAEGDLFNELPVIKALDNLCSQQLIHEDVLPFILPDIQPVQAVSVPDEMTKKEALNAYPKGRIEVIEAYKDGFNACRAAMLANQPLFDIDNKMVLAFYRATNDGGDLDNEQFEYIKTGLSAAMLAKQEPVSAAIRDVIAERQRQINAEGWTPERDDNYHHGELSYAAACYAVQPNSSIIDHELIPEDWPWDKKWWKPSTERRNLIKAGALILAEIERLDRANGDKGAKL